MIFLQIRQIHNFKHEWSETLINVGTWNLKWSDAWLVAVHDPTFTEQIIILL